MSKITQRNQLKKARNSSKRWVIVKDIEGIPHYFTRKGVYVNSTHTYWVRDSADATHYLTRGEAINALAHQAGYYDGWGLSTEFCRIESMG